MKSPKHLTPQQLVEAAQIGGLLAVTVENTGRTCDDDRRKAAAWWGQVLADLRARYFQGIER